MKTLAFVLLLGVAACTGGEPNYEAEGEKLKVGYGEVPEEIRTAAGKILNNCQVPVSAVTLYPPHGPWARGWSIQLPRSQATPKTTACIERESNDLSPSAKITWHVEPPPPPPGWQMKEEYLLIAAERRVPEPAAVPPIPDARTLLPKVLHSCGIHDFREREIIDGIVALKFAVTPRERTDRISCVQREQPRGAWVEPAS